MASLKIGGMSLRLPFQKTKLKLMRPCHAQRAQTRSNKGRSREPRDVSAVSETTNQNGRGSRTNFHKKNKTNSKMEVKKGGREPTGRGRDHEQKKSSVCSTI